MDTNQEITKLRSYSYSKLCKYLINKYGPVNGSYFVNCNCKTKNEKIKRTNEGLFIHHVYESKAIMLSHSEYALKFPFEWQEGNNLVYCNYFEHFLLHFAIVKEFMKEETKQSKMAVGIGGLINFIIPEIIDYINGYNYSRDYMKKAMSVIDGNELLFIDLVNSLDNYLHRDQDLFHIFYQLIGKSVRRLQNIFKTGKMTKSGKYNDFLFEYKVLKNKVPLVDYYQFITKFEKELDKPGYGYDIKISRYGKYYSIDFSFYSKGGWIVSKQYAIPFDDKIDLNNFVNLYFDELFVSNNYKFLIKKQSSVSYKENKKTKNKTKRYCLTIDGIDVSGHKYTKEQVEAIVKLRTT